MSTTKESWQDVVREMRQLVAGVPPNNLFVTVRKILQWANRLEESIQTWCDDVMTGEREDARARMRAEYQAEIQHLAYRIKHLEMSNQYLTGELHKRLERVQVVREYPVGNFQALLDALMECRNRAWEMREYVLRSTDAKACAEQILSACDSGIFAPSRNCDVYSTGSDMWRAFLKSSTSDMDKHENTDFINWLSSLPPKGTDHA